MPKNIQILGNLKEIQERAVLETLEEIRLNAYNDTINKLKALKIPAEQCEDIAELVFGYPGPALEFQAKDILNGKL